MLSTSSTIALETDGEKPPRLTKASAAQFRRDPAGFCDAVYRRLHSSRYIEPDPLQLVREYPDRGDREVAALICSALALGRVDGILGACRGVLSRLGRPREGLLSRDETELRLLFHDFVYRFFRVDEVLLLLTGIRGALMRHGSLEAAFAAAAATEPTERLAGFVDTLVALGRGRRSILLPDPRLGSASKRLHLFLRWMVRRDEVDPGGWSCLTPGDLMVPVDTHMLALARALGITSRRQADRRTGQEITGFFRLMDGDDPVRFDFSLTRLGIHPEIRSELAYDSA